MLHLLSSIAVRRNRQHCITLLGGVGEADLGRIMSNRSNDCPMLEFEYEEKRGGGKVSGTRKGGIEEETCMYGGLHQ